MTRARRGLTGLHTDEHLKLVSVLAEARRSAGLSQYEVADRLGVDQSYVSKYETGRRRLDVIEFLRIVAVIGADPSAILNQIMVDRPS